MVPTGAMRAEPANFHRMPNIVWTAVAGAVNLKRVYSEPGVAATVPRTAKFMSISSMTPSSLGGVSMITSMLPPLVPVTAP